MKTIITLLLCFMMTACGLWSSNKEKLSLYERRSATVIDSDESIESDSRDELEDNKELLRGSHIIITAYNHAVLLTGEAPSLEAKQKIIELIRVIKPIKKVYDYIALSAPSDFSVRANDALINQTVTQAFKQIHGLAHFNPALIKVISTRHIVYLMGLVHRDEGNIVTKLTRLQANVKGIVTVFEYLD